MFGNNMLVSMDDCIEWSLRRYSGVEFLPKYKIDQMKRIGEGYVLDTDELRDFVKNVYGQEVFDVLSL